MLLGEQIQKIRKRAGLTQSELGQRLGVSGSMIGQWEANHRAPKYETIARIAKALDVSIDELCGVWESPLTEDIAQSFLEHREALKTSHAVKGSVFALSSVYARDIISAFSFLNEQGQEEAANRVWELASLTKYQRVDDGELPEPNSSASSNPPSIMSDSHPDEQ